MKANELMIGDFVFHEKYGNAIIESIDNDFGDNLSVRLISENIQHKDGYKYGYCWCNLDEIFPIPLTPEILEKNGFVEDGEGVYGDDNSFFIPTYQNGFYTGTCETYIESTEGIGDFSGRLKYVHELQHALKLCGIEKEIVL